MLISPYRQAYDPGNWIGKVNMGTGEMELLIVGICGVLALVSALLFRQWWLALGMSLLFVGLLYFIPSRFGSGDPIPRFRAEQPFYKGAVKTRTRFGDQFSETINGRSLIYWRWMTWDLDNAVGVIYDPADKLTTEGDEAAFQGPAKGVLFKIRKIEPKWYFVEHS